MIELQNVNSGYGDIQILRDISMKMKKDELTVIVGPNGAGKTTLLRTILGLINTYSGEILVDGKSLRELTPHKRVRDFDMGYMPQRRSLFEELTVKENLRMGGYLVPRSMRGERIQEVFDIFPVLSRQDYLTKKASQLSGGERQMLSMAMAILKNPAICFLDEPSGGLMPKLTMKCLNKVEEIREEIGTQIILTEEKAQFALKRGDKGYLIVDGEISTQGDAEELLKDPELREKYFGVK